MGYRKGYDAELIAQSNDNTVSVLCTMCRVMVDMRAIRIYNTLNKTSDEIEARAKYLFLRYDEVNMSKFYIVKSRQLDEASVLDALNDVFPLIPREAWSYHGYSVDLEHEEDQMLLKLSYGG